MSQDTSAELFMLEQSIGRTRWRFTFPASEVMTAVATRAVEHRERERHYTSERERFAANLAGETGMADKMHSTASIPIQNPFQPFELKMREHQAQAEAYERWARALKTAGNHELSLTYDDVSFFGL
jgi:hypothetical protein